MASIASVSPRFPVIRDSGQIRKTEFLMLSKQRRARGFCAGNVHHLFYLLYFGGQ